MRLSGVRLRAADIRFLAAVFVCLFFLIGTDADDDCNSNKGSVNFLNQTDYACDVYVRGPNTFRLGFTVAKGLNYYFSANKGVYEYTTNFKENPRLNQNQTFIIKSYGTTDILLR